MNTKEINSVTNRHEVFRGLLFTFVIFISIVITSCSVRRPYNDKILNTKQLAHTYFGSDFQWYLANIPFFECSDKKIQNTYYYRWKLYKAHLRYVGEDGYIVTEFLNRVGWDRFPYSSLNDATGFHIYEGRWLRNNRYLDDYINYMYRDGGNDRHFSEGIAYAAYARFLVNSDSTVLMKLLPSMEYIYNRWDDHYDYSKGLYYIMPLLDATEYTIASIDASGGKDGFFGGTSFRPSINSYMYGNALVISRIASMKGDSEAARFYKAKAIALRDSTDKDLWNNSLKHFIDRYKVNNKYVHYWNFIRGRELVGYVPWCYNLPQHHAKYAEEWKQIMDTNDFLGKYGLRTVGPSYQYYMKQYRYDKPTGKPECQWNGPSWPFQTTQVLQGMANLLNNYSQDYVNISDYLKLLRQYTQQHFISPKHFNLQEDYNPDTGKPIVGLYRSSHYNHSEYNNLIITGLCGIRPSKGNVLTINPLVDSTIQYFCLQDVLYHGHNLTILFDRSGKHFNRGKGLTVYIDGKKEVGPLKLGNIKVHIPKPIVQKPKHYPKDIAVNILQNGYPIPSASVNSVPDSLYPAIDGRIWYFHSIRNRWSTLGSKSATNWYALDFGSKREITCVKVYFYADNKTFAAPSNYVIQNWKEGKWVDIKNPSKQPLKPIGNTVNTVNFPKINTSKIRVVFTNAKNHYSTAVAEIKVFSNKWGKHRNF